jgi:hypothetical protein
MLILVQRLLQDRAAGCVKGLGVRVASLRMVHLGQVAERDANVGVLGAKGLMENLEIVLKKGVGFCEAALGFAQTGEAKDRVAQ